MSTTTATLDNTALHGDTGTALRFITCGSVDDGKSTLIGRLLVDSKTVLQDQLAGVQRGGEGPAGTPARPNHIRTYDARSRGIRTVDRCRRWGMRRVPTLWYTPIFCFRSACSFSVPLCFGKSRNITRSASSRSASGVASYAGSMFCS